MPRKVAQKAGLPSDSSGYTTWQTSSNITTGGDLSELSKFDNNASKFSHTVKIEHDDAFRLQALTITEGALKGRKVLMLEPVVTEHFRFLDLPPEIRNMIYDELLKEEKPIRVITYKAKERDRRAVRNTLHWSRNHPGMTWNGRNGNWDGMPPSAYAILQTNKQVLREAGPVAYGNSVFEFDGLPELRTFLEGIGNMRKYIRSIAITGWWYHTSVATTALHKLKAAKSLRSLTFCQQMFRDDFHYAYKSISVHRLVRDCMPLLKVLQRAQASQDLPHNVLEIIEITGEDGKPCKSAKDGNDCSCYYYIEGSKCKNIIARTTKQNAELRSLLGKQLGTKK